MSRRAGSSAGLRRCRTSTTRTSTTARGEDDRKPDGLGGAGRLPRRRPADVPRERSEEHTSELQSLMRISYAVFCLKKKNRTTNTKKHQRNHTTNRHKQSQ